MEADTEMKDIATLSDADSLVSTAPSEQGSEYEVEEILAQRVSKRTGKKKFLLKWTGYPLYRATWEPAEMFLRMEDAILKWDEKRRRARAGTDRLFDVEGWKRALKDREQETQKRKEARRQKRAERAVRKHAKRPRSNAPPVLISRESSPDIPLAHVSRQSSPDMPLIRANASQVKFFQRAGSLASDKSSLFVSADDPETKNPFDPRILASSIPTTTECLPDSFSSGPAWPGVEPPNSSLSVKTVSVASEDHTLLQPSQGIAVTSEKSQPPRSVPSQLLPEGSKAAPSAQDKASDKKPSQGTGRKPTTGPQPAQEPQSQRPMASSSQTVKQSALEPLYTVFASNKSKDREPDISQLNLRKPSEFPARAAAGVPVPFAKMTASESIRRSSQSGIKATTTNNSSISQTNASSRASRKESSETMRSPSWAPRAPQVERSSRPRPPSPRRSSLSFGGDCYRPNNPRDSPPPRRPESRWRSSRSRSRSRSPGHWPRTREPRQRSPAARRRSPDYHRPGDRYRPSNASSPFVTVTRPRSNAPVPTTSSRSSSPRKFPPVTAHLPNPASNAGNEPGSVKDDAVALSTKPQGLPKGPQVSVKDQIERMPIGKPLPGSIRLGGRYFCNPDEVLAHVYFGKDRHFVGAVRLCGLTVEVKKDLLAYKDATRRISKFEMWFRDVTPAQYAALCQLEGKAGGVNRVMRTCWMEGFADTNPEIFYMSEFLRWENRVGIYFPPGNEGYVWLAFSPKSPDFGHLTLPLPEINPWVPIRLAVRSPLPDALESISLSHPMGPQQTQSSAMAMVPYDPSRTGAPDSLDYVVRRLAQTAGPNNLNGSTHTQGLYGSPMKSPTEQSPDGPPVLGQEARETQPARQTAPALPANVPADPRLRRLSSTASVQQSHQGQAQPIGDASRKNNNEHHQVVNFTAPPDLMDTAPDITVPTSTVLISATQNASMQQLSNPSSMLGEYFERLKITFKELACVNGKHDGPQVDMFYLHTAEGEEGQNDCTTLKMWLEMNGAVTWSDWAKFVKNSKCGVVLFHESFGKYDALRPYLRDALGNSSMGFWTFRVSKPLDYPDERYSQQGVYFQRIFCRGGAYLLTQDVLHSLKETVVIVYWFFSIQSRYPGQWKLVCWPNLMEHLEEMLEDSSLPKDEQKLIFTLSWLIRKCNSIDSGQPVYQPDSLDPTNLDNANNNILSLRVAGYGQRSAESHPGLPQDLTQAERNADHLAEAFAGWSIENVARLRRSYIISNCKNEVLLKRWNSWGHVIFFSVRAFIEKYKINVNDMLERIHHRLNKSNKPSRPPQTGQASDKAHIYLSSPTQTPETPSTARPSGVPTPREPHADPSNQPRSSQWRQPQPQGEHTHAAPYH